MHKLVKKLEGKSLRIFAGITMLGLSIGMGIKLYSDGYVSNISNDIQDLIEDEDSARIGLRPTAQIPANGVKSSELSLKLLKVLAKKTKQTNFIFSPLALEQSLEQLKHILSEEDKKLLDALPLQRASSNLELGSPARGVASFYIDRSISQAQCPSFDFAQQRDKSIIDLNGLVEKSTHGAISHIINGEIIRPKSKLIGINAITQELAWREPFINDEQEGISFIEESGRETTVASMSSISRDTCYLSYPDYDVYAIMLQEDEYASALLRKKGQDIRPSFLTIIVPKKPIREFITEQLSTKKLSDIRHELIVKSHNPINRKLSMPCFSLQPHIYDMQPLMREIGLNSLFRHGRSQGLKIDRFIQVCSINMQPEMHEEPMQNISDEKLTQCRENLQQRKKEEMSPASTTAAAPLIINRPFLWMVGDLSSDEPPSLMGIIERL